MAQDIAVIGAGSWGTAIATVLAELHEKVILWARRDDLAQEINEQHENSAYLPGVRLSEKIVCETSIEKGVRNKKYIFLVVPSHAMRETVQQIAPYLREDAILIHATKGIEIGSLKRMTEVIKEEIPLGLRNRVAVISGPSHAEEVAIQSPTTVVVASENIKIAEEVQDIINTNFFRVYANPDVIGVEIGGALKNIIALGAGLSDGLNFGDNAKAALLTRGLAEISRFGIVLGGNPLTFSGLSGLGDLVVTAAIAAIGGQEICWPRDCLWKKSCKKWAWLWKGYVPPGEPINYPCNMALRCLLPGKFMLFYLKIRRQKMRFVI